VRIFVGSFFFHFNSCVAEHVNDMVYSVERLNALVGAARVDLEAFKSREQHHRQSMLTPAVCLALLHREWLCERVSDTFLSLWSSIWILFVCDLVS
jgi:hypothetical protein